MAPMKCESASTLKYHVENVRDALSQPETEESWDTIARSITTLTTLCEGGACDFETDLITAVRSFSRPLNSAINSERSKLSGAALDLVAALASGLGPSFEPLLPLFLPTLLTLCSRSNKVFMTRSRACIFTIIESTQLPALFGYFLQSLKDKAITLRLAATEGILACMNCFNPPDLEKEARAREIEAVIRATARDASADIRKASRKIFEAYKVLLPNRVDRFTEPLSPTMKKYLNISSRPPVQLNPVPRLRSGHQSAADLRSKATFSSSTGVINSRSQTHGPDEARANTRPASAMATSTVSGPSREAKTDVERPNTRLRSKAIALAPVPAQVKAPNAMPPPDYVPVRPVQPAQRPTPAERVAAGSRTIAASSQASRSIPITGNSGARRVNQGATQATSVAVAPTTQAQRVAVTTKSTDGPIRPFAASTNSNSDGTVPGPSYVTGGARRVPMTEAMMKEREEAAKARRPISRADNVLPKPGSSAPVRPTSEKQKSSATSAGKATTLVARLRAQEVAKAASRNVPNSSNDASTKARTTKAPAPSGGEPSRVRTRSQAKETSKERKAETTKPVWGRQVPRQAPAATKAQAAKVKNPEKKKAPSPEPEKVDAVEEVPIPNPPRTPTPPPVASVPAPTTTQEWPPAPLPAPPAEDQKKVVKQSILSLPHIDAPTTIGNIPIEVKYTSDEAAYKASVARVCAVLQAKPPRMTISPKGTPISDLLSSIQKGFLPSPTPYPPRERFIQMPEDEQEEQIIAEEDGFIPFPLTGVIIPERVIGEDGVWYERKMPDYMGEGLRRFALGDVEVNVIY